jgi:peptidoglycan/xylan/chitin deacetylase (PgdA/CDA1 family)
MMFRACLALCLAFALGPSLPADAKGWPTPAAGDSPDGSVQIVFTFDDGPNPQTTPLVLDILAKHKIKAVFFLVGEMVETRNKAVPKILDRMLREGHVIANHTMRHKDLCKLKDEAKAVEDLDRGKETIEKATHIQLGWLRLPYGVRCERVDRLLEERRLKHFHWDLDPQEWKHGNLDKTVKYITTQIGRAGGREVLLLHDIKKVTVEALPEVLKYIDDENARREKSRKMKIKILDAPDLAIEQLPKGLTTWLADATEGVRALPKTVASLLP